ncbi:exopolysaccharide production protein [Arenivirga flava]|uniref:Exopolysaccharide production protein n=1 Tax=Arenivirga flava TaxID=1930060 RepID=A0AA37UCJ5_9MICO|nr:exopolysaccharide production protein [Arenivirga flava]GMA27999.1 hypothetical protein GCM10025874_12520 [Arenivirga flava]
MTGIVAPLLAFVGHARFVQAWATCAVAAIALSHLVRQLSGWAGYIGLIGALVALGAAIVWARRDRIEWNVALPISVAVLLGLSALSVVWSQYQWVTVGGVALQVGTALLGLIIAATRDLIQIVRVVGDVLRAALLLSVALEVLAGLLIDMPIVFLGIRGDLATGGPIQGVFGDQAALSLAAVVAGASFVVELRTRSVSRLTGALSLVLAGLCLLFASSVVAVMTAAAALVVGWLLSTLRRAAPETRSVVSVGLLLLAVVIALTLYLSRAVVVTFITDHRELAVRLPVWREVVQVAELQSVLGWGWSGIWRTDIPPFLAIDGRFLLEQTSARGAFFDIWLQLGLVGVMVLVVLLGLAFGRGWLLALRQRTVVACWPAVVLAALIAYSTVESGVLVGFGWLLLVVCAAKVSGAVSWRTRAAAEAGRR